MRSAEVRKAFIRFFETKGHSFVPSSPIVNKDDPTLLFTNSGMNQFKDIFTGNKKVSYTRAVNSQKCLRVSGKHNDLEDVGIDTYHHTMFEMLGNWSFGDYFKKEAIAWAWEFLTQVLTLSPDRLYVTVFGGDNEENLPRDEESARLWEQWIAKDRILFFRKKENFWEMGETGPCGPCTEIHIDLRPDAERTLNPAQALVNKDHPQVIEIWNLVFMEFYRRADGTLQPLTMKSVDTGMGFERLCRALQNKNSNYDTDVFEPLQKHLEQLTGLHYGQDTKQDIAFRVVMDHCRAVTFAIADGQIPSNTGAGYVIRRIIRRAIRYAFQFLNLNQPFLHSFVPILAKQFQDIFPEIAQQQAFIQNILLAEEKNFLHKLEKGITLFQKYLEENPNATQIAGEFAFELYDTYGFPLDLTELMAREHHKQVDKVAFEKCMQVQRQRSKQATQVQFGDWYEVLPNHDLPLFVGYETLDTSTEIVKYREVRKGKNTQFQVVLTVNPFYAESGGQVGDTGLLFNEQESLKVLDCIKENELSILITDKLPSHIEGVWRAKVDAERRKFIRANHSATHLLHAALRTVLGKHVEQKGSLVHPDYLRFDFSHFQKLTDEELKAVENLVNQKIAEAIPLTEERDVPIEQAKQKGAMALFGEKYGDTVRVITFDPNYSVELCGGTHVNNTAHIQLFKIVHETSIAAGIRRIEAYTAQKALLYLNQQHQQIQQIAELFNQPKDLFKAIQDHLQHTQQLEKQLEMLLHEKMLAIRDQLLHSQTHTDPNGVHWLVLAIPLNNADLIKNLSFELRKLTQKTIIVLAANLHEKPFFSVIFSQDLEPNDAYNAVEIVKGLAKHIQGGGGGQPFYATAGGKNLDGIPHAFLELFQKRFANHPPIQTLQELKPLLKLM